VRANKAWWFFRKLGNQFICVVDYNIIIVIVDVIVDDHRSITLTWTRSGRAPWGRSHNNKGWERRGATVKAVATILSDRSYPRILSFDSIVGKNRIWRVIATSGNPELETLVGKSRAEIVAIKVVSITGADKKIARKVIAPNRPEWAVNKSWSGKERTRVVHRAEKESTILQSVVPISGNQHKAARREDPA